MHGMHAASLRRHLYGSALAIACTLAHYHDYEEHLYFNIDLRAAPEILLDDYCVACIVHA